MSLADLTADETALIHKFKDAISANGGAMTHDLGDPEHLAFVKLMHTICGNTPEDFPGLHAMLDAPAPQAAVQGAASLDETAEWVTAFGVPEIGYEPASRCAAATGYGTVVNGFQTCNLSLLVLAPDGTFLAHGSSAAQYPLANLVAETNDADAKAFQPGSTGMMTYSYQPMEGPPVSATVSAVSSGAASDPVVIEPKRENGNTDPYNPNAINIGLGRDGDLIRCDYIFNEPNQDHPVGRLPLVGNVTFTNAIKTLQPGTNFIVDIYVIRDSGGQSTQLDATDLNNIYANFNIDPGNGKVLQWNLPMRANTSPPPPDQPYNPVVFSNIPWATEMVSYLTANITVRLEDGTANGTPVTVTIQSSDLNDQDPIDGVTYIKPIEFIWHCLGEDTIVAMADGAELTIPEIKAGDSVRGAKGGADATVSVTHNGHHFHDVYVLETACGKSLVASAEHIIMTADGGVPARDLATGASLVTPDGPTALTAIRKEPGGGRNLWNLSLGEAPQTHDDNPDVGQFFANGILVGDARAARALRHRQIQDMEFVKANVPEAFHRDVESTFKRRTRIVQR